MRLIINQFYYDRELANLLEMEAELTVVNALLQSAQNSGARASSLSALHGRLESLASRTAKCNENLEGLLQEQTEITAALYLPASQASSQRGRPPPGAPWYALA